jgi:membrane fusion protein, multidrug efflux system
MTSQRLPSWEESMTLDTQRPAVRPPSGGRTADRPRPGRPARSVTGRRERSVTALLAAGLLAVTGMACESGQSQTDSANGQNEVPRNVRVLTIAAADLETFLTISGPTRALQGADLSAEEGGLVAAIAKEKGATVHSGDELILLDRGLLAAEQASAQANRELQSYNTERMRQLRAANSISELELRQAETQLQDARAREAMARIRYERAAIRAPFRGVIADRYVEVGQLVSPGQPVVRLVDPYTLVLRAGISEKEIGTISAGKIAAVTFDGIPGQFTGTIHWVGIEADRLTGKFPVEIHIPNPDAQLRPGVIGRARISKAVHQDVVMIPRDAVLSRPSGPVAFVANGQRAEQRVLSLGVDQGLMVIVTDGLAPGDRLIVRGQREVRAGSAITVQEVAASSDGSRPGDPDVIKQERTVSERWSNGNEKVRS